MKIKDLMIPVGEYETVHLDACLGDVASALEVSGHRDLLVVDDNGDLSGIVTMADVIIALEPNYKKLGNKDLDSDILSNRFVADQFKELNLWHNKLDTLCKQAHTIAIKDVMHVPEKQCYINIDDDLELGVHLYIIGAPQPLVVGDNGTVVGILRMADIFDEIIKRMNVCVENQA